MKFLITGSEGSLMQAVIPKLLAQGHTVVGIDNLYRYGQVQGSGYNFNQLDLLDFDKIAHLFKDVDYIIHAAAKIYGVGGFNKFCADIIGDDISIFRNILQLSVKNNIKRIIYISSSMVYETCIQDPAFPVDETMVESCPMPKTDYGLSKLVGERLCYAFHKQYGLDYTIWRPFNIITPYELAEGEQGISHVFADFIKNILVKKLNPLPIIGDGEQIRCFTWIDDVANIVAEYSLKDVTKNQEFNICNVEPISMKELAKKIYSSTKNEKSLEFNTVIDYKNDVRVRIPSIQKLTTAIGEYKFQPVDISIKRCIDNVSDVLN